MLGAQLVVGAAERVVIVIGDAAAELELAARVAGVRKSREVQNVQRLLGEHCRRNLVAHEGRGERNRLVGRGAGSRSDAGEVAT